MYTLVYTPAGAQIVPMDNNPSSWTVSSAEAPILPVDDSELPVCEAIEEFKKDCRHNHALLENVVLSPAGLYKASAEGTVPVNGTDDIPQLVYLNK